MAEVEPTGSPVCEGVAASTVESDYAYVDEGSEEVAKAFWALLLDAGYTVW